MYAMWIEVIPALHRFGSTWLACEDSLASTMQLQQRFLVAVIWLILTDYDYVWFLDLRHM